VSRLEPSPKPFRRLNTPHSTTGSPLRSSLLDSPCCRVTDRAALAFVNGAMIVGMSMLTDYPGGVFRTLSFRAHRTGDIVQAALAGLGSILFGFGTDPEAKYFYGQAASEAGVIAATDWNAAA
jgi:hypothetical protein